MEIGRGAADDAYAGGKTPETIVSGASWEHFIRDDLVDQVCHAVLQESGAVLEGEPGTGKAPLAAAVLARIRDRVHVIQLGSHELRDGNEGLGGLLASLSADDPGSEREVMEAIRRLVADSSGGMPVLLHIPDFKVLAGQVAGVLAGLALSGTFSILAISGNHVGENISKLVQSIRLKRIYLEALSLDQTQWLLERVLGGEPSRAAVFALWSGAAGHRRLLETLTLDWHDAGFLSRRDGVWVVAGNHPPVGERTARAWREMLEVLPEEQRELVELVALAGRIPLHDLLGLVSIDDVDVIHDLGYLRFGRDHLRAVKLRGTCSAAAVAEQVPPGRAAMLLERLSTTVSGPLPVGAAHLYSWQVVAGMNPRNDLAVEASEHCLGTGDVQGALGFLDGVADLSSDPRYLDAYMRALHAAGHVERAHDELELHGLADWVLDGGDHDAGQLAGQLASRHGFRLALTSLQVAAEARNISDTVLHEVFSGLVDRIGEARTSGNPNPEELDERSATARLHLLELAHRHGQPSWCADFQYSDASLEGDRLWRWQLLLNSAAVSLGDVKTGIQRGRELTLLVHQTASSGSQRLATHVGLFTLCMVAGEWAAAAEVIDGSWIGGRESSRLDDTSNLYAGVVLALQGRPDEALARLENELVQRKFLDAEGVHGVGLAAAAYASARRKDFEDAERLLYALNDVEDTLCRPPMDVVRATRHLRALTEAELGHFREGIGDLMSVAAQDRECGRISWELLALSAAAMLKHEPAFELLEERAGASTGRFATACRQYAAAHRHRDLEELHVAARTFELLGHPELASAAKGSVPVPAPGTRADRHGNRILAEPARRGPDVPEGRPGPTGLAGRFKSLSLTSRQVDIAGLAASGKSNKEIADDLELSVRTVESHLYQIYSRLGVTRREELKNALARTGE
ncbi:helix-turn-helix transcriptional regulator [Paeniglutamicibacter psychrophenolicus]|uniref:helix-turn-helix transcriptional regulator n=1 Tax=Paeniglutamicibacter psychrophenolicus TaxID=257454 RepID=UPI0027858AA1|nr:helix-turn-helix transcriptional regulator [Paeniglutamicibacter psychrophenolicus]MDQ0092635.1 DNA-binding CsgD family transcriptional regulator [Paeniglutamicibacter psychrophenolicus]